jgi:hypothetical protein
MLVIDYVEFYGPRVSEHHEVYTVFEVTKPGHVLYAPYSVVGMFDLTCAINLGPRGVDGQWVEHAYLVCPD